MNILVINSGSSSIKYKLFRMPGEKFYARGVIEHIGEKGSAVRDHYQGLARILEDLKTRVDVVGHRVVHGAEKFARPVVIDRSVISKIRQCCEIAPLHNPANLAGIMACKKLLPGVRQVAVFDTAFHQTLPEHAYIYGLPYRYYQRWRIRKYGFHGTSHEYVAHEAARILKRPLRRLKLITCHLGNGCSIAAVEGGKSIDTSMGFTPLEGLVMGTRCGDIDPALITHIMRVFKLDVDRMDAMLNKESGLAGISGLSNDIRILYKKACAGNMRAGLALDIFAYRIKKYIGAYIAALSGCDAVVFTAGIGQNSKPLRDMICGGIFKPLKRKPRILVIPTDEELMIARQAFKLVQPHKKRGS